MAYCLNVRVAPYAKIAVPATVATVLVVAAKSMFIESTMDLK